MTSGSERRAARALTGLPPDPVHRGTVVLATYNEAGAIDLVLQELAESAASLALDGIVLRVLLVDDRSPDGTACCAELAAERLGLELEVLSGDREGLGRAFMRGFAHELVSCPPEFFVTLDADGQHDARQVAPLVRTYLANGCAVLIGSRWTAGGTSPGTGRVRTALSRAGNAGFRVVTGTPGVRDATTSFRVIDPSVVRAFAEEDVHVQGYAFFSAFVAVAVARGFTVAETPITFRPRGSGESKLSTKECVRFAVGLPALRRVVRRTRATARRGAALHPAGSGLVGRVSG